jgi:hypothetical protein
MLQKTSDYKPLSGKCEVKLETSAGKALKKTSATPDMPAAPTAPVAPAAPEQPPAVAIYQEMVAEHLGTIAALNREIGALKGENMSIARQNVELAAQNSVITEQNRELTAQNRELTALAEQNRALAEQNRALYMENHSIKKELEELRIFMGRPVVSPMPLSGVPEQQDAAGLMAAELAERYRRKPPDTDTPAPTPIAPTRAKSPRVQARPR